MVSGSTVAQLTVTASCFAISLHPCF
jgi:hypothetical protein